MFSATNFNLCFCLTRNKSQILFLWIIRLINRLTGCDHRIALFLVLDTKDIQRGHRSRKGVRFLALHDQQTAYFSHPLMLTTTTREMQMQQAQEPVNYETSISLSCTQSSSIRMQSIFMRIYANELHLDLCCWRSASNELQKNKGILSFLQTNNQGYDVTLNCVTHCYTDIHPWISSSSEMQVILTPLCLKCKMQIFNLCKPKTAYMNY